MDILVDIDGFLTLEDKGWTEELYRARTPNSRNISLLDRLWRGGGHIILYSARFEQDRSLTLEWLEKYAVKYDELILGKPPGSVYMDSRSLPYIEPDLRKYLEYDFHHTCWRFKNGSDCETKEEHPCFFCGESIPLSTDDCSECGIMKCPSCGHCLCNVPTLSLITIIRIHEKYCCDLPSFKGRVELNGFVDANVIQYAEKALQYCFKKAGLGG